VSCSVHDVIDLEARGIPAVFVATTEFVDAAAAQARALGADPARVFVPHPVQDRTDEEMHAMADAAVDDVLRALAASPDR
jgi:hypothetical protein